MSEVKLKPCPFCGGEAEICNIYDHRRSVRCHKCWAKSVFVDESDIKEAVEAWNKRVHR